MVLHGNAPGGGVLLYATYPAGEGLPDGAEALAVDLRGARVVCRNGSPIDLDDLDLGSPETARAIVVLGPEDADDPDVNVIKTVLALVGHKKRERGDFHIVAEIRDIKNRIPAEMVGGRQVELVMSSDVIPSSPHTKA